MNVLMISIDKGLLGENPLGDVIARHAEYGKRITSLDIIVHCPPGYEEFNIASNVRAYPTNSKRKTRRVRDTVSIGKKLATDKKYDLVVTQDPFLTGLAGRTLKRSLQIPLVVNLHGDYINNPHWENTHPLHRVLAFVARYVIERADAVRVMSRGQKEKLTKLYPKKRIEVIATPVQLDTFAHPESSYEKKWKYVVMMVGRKDDVKDFTTLFKSMSILFEKRDDVGLYLVGNYTKDDKVPLPEKRVKAFGSVPAHELPNLYASADVVVLTSTSESFGKVLVEANASGKPVVATDTTGAVEIIENGYNGYIVPKGDAQKMAERLEELLVDDALRKKMGAQGKELMAKRYSNNTDKLIAFWKELIA